MPVNLNRLERVTGWLALLTLAMAVILLGNPAFTSASFPPRGIPDPILGLQMARNVAEVDDVLGEAPSPDREAMRIKQYWDFGFIACYVCLYLALSVLMARTFPQWTWLAVSMAICGLGAAVFDVIENLAILRILDVKLNLTTQAMVDAIHHPSMIKWTLVFITLAILSAYFLRQDQWRMRAVGLVNAAASVLGFVGLLANALIAWAAFLMLLGLIGTILIFFRLK